MAGAVDHVLDLVSSAHDETAVDVEHGVLGVQRARRRRIPGVDREAVLDNGTGDRELVFEQAHAALERGESVEQVVGHLIPPWRSRPSLRAARCSARASDGGT